MSEQYGPETLALHSGARAPLLGPGTHLQHHGFNFKTPTMLRDYLRFKSLGLTRIMNPTTDVLEKRIAALEGGQPHCRPLDRLQKRTHRLRAGDHVVAGSALTGAPAVQ